MNVLTTLNLFACAVLLNNTVIAQPVHAATATAYLTAGASSPHYRNAFSFLSNPACLAAGHEFQAGLLIERKWLLKELNVYVLSAAFELAKGGLGVCLQQSGEADYHERSLKLGYGKSLGRIELGVSFNYLQTTAANYPVTGFGSAGLGLQLHLSDKFITGLYIDMNVLGKAGKEIPETGASQFQMAFGYEMRDDLFLAVQIVKLKGSGLNVIGSLEYRYGDHFFFSIGLNSLEGLPYFKSGFRKNNLSIQLYAVYETVLGFTPGLMVLWEHQPKTK